MPKTSAHPGLRVHRWRDKAGRTLEAYYYDMRKAGQPDIPLGSDRQAAIELAAVIRSGGKLSPLAPPRAAAKRLDQLTAGSRRKLPEDLWPGAPKWAKAMYLGAERRSKAAGRVEFLTVPEFMAAVIKAAGRCELSGIPFDERGAELGKRRPFGPSLDRMDASKGYVVGNVRLVCLLANQALGDWGDEPLDEFVEAVMRKRSPNSSASMWMLRQSDTAEAALSR